MEPNEIIEGNKLIADFMGWQKGSRPDVYQVPNAFPIMGEESGWTEWRASELGFDNQWNYLMPVVDKIRKDYDLTIQFMDGDCNVFVNKQTFNNDEIFSIGGYSNSLDAVWLAVVRFVKWYNQQNKEHGTK